MGKVVESLDVILRFLRLGTALGDKEYPNGSYLHNVNHSIVNILDGERFPLVLLHQSDKRPVGARGVHVYLLHHHLNVLHHPVLTISAH